MKQLLRAVARRLEIFLFVDLWLVLMAAELLDHAPEQVGHVGLVLREGREVRPKAGIGCGDGLRAVGLLSDRGFVFTAAAIAHILAAEDWPKSERFFREVVTVRLIEWSIVNWYVD